MRKIITSSILLLLLLPIAIKAQEKGIHFEHGLTWKEIKAKAKAENKFIFMDCFTTWCGPCKLMVQLVFPQDTTGTFFNEHFINVKMQMDKAAADNPDVKLLYADAEKIAKEYGVHIYPTFLYFSPDGKLVHRIIGAIFDPTAFVGKSAEALNPATQYYTLLEQFNAGHLTNPEDIYQLALMAKHNDDGVHEPQLAAAYLAAQKDTFTAKNLQFIYTLTEHSKDNTFPFLLTHGKGIDKILGKGKTARLIQDIALAEDNLPAGQPVDWKKKAASLAKKYPGYDKEIFARLHVTYFLATKNWQQLNTAMRAYIGAYPDDIEPYEMNAIANRVFDDCPDKTCLATALDWSKMALDKGDLSSVFTYSDLLYKTGRQQDAIQILEKLLQQKQIGQEIVEEKLESMKKGEKTWSNP
ncbi:thioredoxin family protein [Chitinophaga sp. 30R24]|uniref:thioredoxin family protein n=1 Tax=Chitinophaga sp. 30R24 TaxID=3248838 RepID=UPI003B9039FF